MSKKTESALGLVPVTAPLGLSLVGKQPRVCHHARQFQKGKSDRRPVARAVPDHRCRGFQDRLRLGEDGRHPSARRHGVRGHGLLHRRSQAGSQGKGYQAAVDEFGTYLLQLSAGTTWGPWRWATPASLPRSSDRSTRPGAEQRKASGEAPGG